MLKFEENRKALENQFDNISWIEKSGIGEAELREEGHFGTQTAIWGRGHLGTSDCRISFKSCAV